VKIILTIMTPFLLLLIVAVSPQIVFGSSAQNASLTLVPNGDITNRSQPLLVKNDGPTAVLYFIHEEGSGLNSEVFAVRPNTTQSIDPTFFSPAEVMQLVAYDFSTNLAISNVVNESVPGQTISMLNISVISERCFHSGNCLDNIKVVVAISKGSPYNGILADNRGDLARIVNDTGILQTGGGWKETVQVNIVAGGIHSNTISITF
jgi:hypothetical protein